MRKVIVLSASFGTLLCCKLSVAQEKAPDLDPITVTSSLTQQKISQSGRNVFIIKGEKLNDLPVHSVDELLRYLPGIEVQARGPMGSQSDIVLRGGTFQQVLVVVDGLRVNDPNTGHFSSYIPIAPVEIDRIEILKGASSAIYGSEAVGGVIHIITKSFASARGEKKTKAEAQVTGGEYNLLNTNSGIYYSNGKSAISAGVLSNNTKGQPQRGINGFVHANTASLSLGQHFNDRLQFNIRFAYDIRDFAAQNFYTTFLSDTASEKVKTSWSQMGLIYTGTKDRVSLNIGYKRLNDHYVYNSISIPNDNKSDLLQALVTDEYKLQPNTILTMGGQFIQKKIVSNDRGNHAINQAAAFAILNQQIASIINLSPAARLEYNERSGWEFIPQINLSIKVNEFQFRGSAGKTIRDADFTERFNNYNKPFVSSGRIGNPDLEAERSFSYEAGIDYFSQKAFRISTTFFQRFHSKLIDYVTTSYLNMPRKENLSPTGSYSLAKNIASVNTRGAETDLQYIKQLEKKQQLWATFGFVWLQSKSSDVAPSFYISSHAKYLANCNIQYMNRWGSLSVNSLYKVRQEQSVASSAIAKVSNNYVIINAKAEGFLLHNQLSLFVEADNMFDVNYTDLLGAKLPGRWLMGGIKLSLSK